MRLIAAVVNTGTTPTMWMRITAEGSTGAFVIMLEISVTRDTAHYSLCFY